MKVRDVMTAEPTCCTPDTSLEAVSRLMIDCDCGAIPVVGDLAAKYPIGIITDRDIVTRVVATGQDPHALTVRECMTSPAITITADSSLADCLKLLEINQIRRMIVVDAAGAVVGMVAQADIAAHATKRRAGELLREVSHPATPRFTH